MVNPSRALVVLLALCLLGLLPQIECVFKMAKKKKRPKVPVG